MRKNPLTKNSFLSRIHRLIFAYLHIARYKICIFRFHRNRPLLLIDVIASNESYHSLLRLLKFFSACFEDIQVEPFGEAHTCKYE